jgi:hypothetical protein
VERITNLKTAKAVGLTFPLKRCRLLRCIYRFLEADAGIGNCKLDPVASVRHPAHPQGDLALFRELAGVA